MKKLLCLLFLTGCIFAQVTKVVPDCVISFSFTATGSTPNTGCGTPNGAPNSNGISSWILEYYSTGYSVLSLVVQSAPDSAGAPGTWVTFAGTVLSSGQYVGSSGINPNTATTSAFTGFAGYYPWMRVTLASVTGTGKVTGHLYGFYNSTIAKAGSGGPPTGACGGDLSSTFPNCTVVNLSHVTNASLANSGLVNASTTVNSVTCTLGSGCTITAVPSGACGGDLTGTFPNCTVDQVNGAAVPASATAVATNGSRQLILATFQGNGAKVQASTGSPTPGDCTEFDASGNTVDAGAPCSASSVGAAGATLFSTTNSTTVVATSPTTLIGTVTGSTTVPANTFTAGQVLEVRAQGFYSTPASPASLTLTLNIGGTVRLSSGVALQLAGASNGVWRFYCSVTTRTTGASGTQIANCIMETTGTPLSGNAEVLPLVSTSTWTIDTTVGEAIDILATWSTATGAPTITSTNIAAWIPGAPVTSVQTLTGAVVLFSPNAQTSTYGATAADFSGCKAITVASGTFTVTLVASGSQPPAGQCVKVINYGSGVVTIARSGQNINGGTSSLTLNAATATAPSDAYVVSDGINYEASLHNPSTGGTTVTAAPPYIVIGGTSYVNWDLAAVTKPTTPTFLNSVTCSNSGAGVNGDFIVTNNNGVGTRCWGGYSATASIEGDFAMIWGSANQTGIWIWDSTNNLIYSLDLEGSSGTGSNLAVRVWTYNGSGNPAASSGNLYGGSYGTLVHFKLSVSAGTLTAAVSGNGGQDFTTLQTNTSIGTISKAGILAGNGSGGIDVYSLVIN